MQRVSHKAYIKHLGWLTHKEMGDLWRSGRSHLKVRLHFFLFFFFTVAHLSTPQYLSACVRTIQRWVKQLADVHVLYTPRHLCGVGIKSELICFSRDVNSAAVSV